MNNIGVGKLDRLLQAGEVTLAQCLASRNNNFNLLRIVAATLVIYSHSFPVIRGWRFPAPGESGDLFQQWTGMIAGGLAVQAFFVMSGLLVAQSFERSPTIGTFVQARALRIYPALIVCICLSALILGPLLTTAGVTEYFSDERVWKYILVNASLLSLNTQLFLPGVFESSPIAGYVNGSIWTLPWEMLMYVSLGVLGLLGYLGRPTTIALVLLGALLVYVGGAVVGEFIPSHKLFLCAGFASYFFAGVLLYQWRDRIRLNWLTLAISIAAWVAVCSLVREHKIALFLYVPTLGYLLINLAAVPKGMIRKYNSVGDYSYGTYIYAWPIQQLLVSSGSFYDPLQLCAAAVAASWGLAFLSWHLVESPALRHKRNQRPGRITGSDREISEPAAH